MKKIFTFLLTLVTLACFAQVPQGISYQAVAFNTGGTPVANGTVGVKISVLDNSATGTVVYSETHTKTTNAQGLFNLNIGQGTPTSGTFSNIDWGTNSKFLKVEVDPSGGTSYINVGVNQLMSVPYALFAEEANTLVNGNSVNSINSSDLIKNKSANFAFNDAQTDIYYAFSSYTNTWAAQPYDNGGGTPSLTESNGNFIFNDAQADIYYIFNSKTGTWSSQAYNNGGGTPALITDTLLSTFVFNDAQTDTYYAFSAETGTWSSQAYNNGGGTPSLQESKGNFLFNDSQTDIFYVFNSKTGTWSSQAYNNGGGTPSVVGVNGSFMFNDSQTDIIYVFNSKSGLWSSQAYNNGGGSPTVISSETD